MREWFKSTRQSLEEFFFAQETPYSLACMRIMLPPIILSMALPRWLHTRELYSNDGATAQLGLGYGYTNFLPEFSGEVAVALNSLMILSLLCMMVGWQTRWALLISFVLYPYFSLLDAISTLTKYSVITTHFLLLLSLSHCGAVWSVDAWLNRNSTQKQGPPPTFSVWPRRLIQILMGAIYFGAAITKINTPTFLSGDQIQLWMLTDINNPHPFGAWLSMYPILLRMMAYVTLVWEMTFIFLVWRSMWRPWILFIGVTFHFMTTLTLGLLVFPMTCYAGYLAFADESDVVRVRQWLKGRLSQITGWPRQAWVTTQTAISNFLGSGERWRSGAEIAFPVLALLTMTAGVGAEYLLDPYGIRRPEGPHELIPVDPKLAARLLAPAEKIRDEDKFFAIDTGRFLVGDLLAGRTKMFQSGQTMVAQCHLVPPHEDMWIECKILDEHRRLVERIGNVAPRDCFRLNFEVPLSASLPPGNYSLVFETAGREVLRKGIVVVGSKSSVAAH